MKTELELLKNELEILTELNDQIRLDMDFDSFLDQIIGTLRRRVQFDGCNFAFIDTDGYMRLHRIRHEQISPKSRLSEDYLDRVYARRYDVKTSPDWACRVARENIEIHLPEIRLDEFTGPDREMLVNYGITSLYYLPIRLEDRVLGTMRFHNYGGPMPLSEFEKELIRRRTSIVARAVENMRLYTDLKRKNSIIEEDLRMAEKIQRNFLPRRLPDFPGIAVEARYLPIKEVGGDYYDFLLPSDGRRHFGVIITDASGHGVPAAFITSMVKMAFKSPYVWEHMASPSAVLREINQNLMDQLAGNFVTAFYCYFDLEEGTLTASCAGHTPAYLIHRKRGEITLLKPSGKFLGLLEEPVFEEIRYDLQEGDRLFLYTDGLTEARNRSGEEFEPLLREMCRRGYHLPLQDFCEQILSALGEHASSRGGETQEDDMAFISLDIIPLPGEQ